MLVCNKMSEHGYASFKAPSFCAYKSCKSFGSAELSKAQARARHRSNEHVKGSVRTHLEMVSCCMHANLSQYARIASSESRPACAIIMSWCEGFLISSRSKSSKTMFSTVALLKWQSNALAPPLAKKTHPNLGNSTAKCITRPVASPRTKTYGDS
jgi:hypothetical protein